MGGGGGLAGGRPGGGMGGMPGGMGGMPGGMGGMAGGAGGMFGRPNPKRDLTTLVRKLRLLTAKEPLTVRLDGEQKKKVLEQLRGLDKEKELSDDDATKRLKELKKILDPEEKTLTAVGFQWPREGRQGGGPGGGGPGGGFPGGGFPGGGRPGGGFPGGGRARGGPPGGPQGEPVGQGGPPQGLKGARGGIPTTTKDHGG